MVTQLLVQSPQRTKDRARNNTQLASQPDAILKRFSFENTRKANQALLRIFACAPEGTIEMFQARSHVGRHLRELIRARS